MSKEPNSEISSRKGNGFAEDGSAILLAVVAGLLAGFLPLLLLHEKPASAVTPAGFTDTLVASVGSMPSGLTFTPDGRMLVLLKTGQVRVYKDGTLLYTPALDISSRVCGEGERGC
jgi:hypothetical protein